MNIGQNKKRQNGKKGRTEKWEKRKDGEMGKKDGEMGKRKDGEMGKKKDGEMEKRKDGEMEKRIEEMEK